MEIKVRGISSSLTEVIVVADNTVIDLGFLSRKEVGELSCHLADIAEELANI